MINFINLSTGRFYGDVLRSIIDPIKKHLPDCMESRQCIDDINVHFFREKRSYFDRLTLKGKNVFISHGIADKNWRDARFMSHFDYVFVSGPLWVDKLVKQGFSKNKIFIAGYTKLDPIFQGEYQRSPNDKKRVLWGPTHNLQGWTLHNASSYPILGPYLEKLPSDYDIISSPHPANAQNGVTMQSLVDCDVVISDCSSILYEAWSLDKPVIFPSWLIKKEISRLYPGSFEERIYREKIGYHVERPEQLGPMVERALMCGITEREKNFIDGIFPPKLRGKSGETTAKILKELSKK